MQEKHVFEYAVIRIVPRVDREEFLNVGVIMYCPAQGFLQTLYELPKQRLQAFGGVVDFQELEDRLLAFKKVCAGRTEGGIIGQLPIAARFRWLTAARSTIVQTSPVHTGLCIDAQQTINRLYAQLVK